MVVVKIVGRVHLNLFYKWFQNTKWYVILKGYAVVLFCLILLYCNIYHCAVYFSRLSCYRSEDSISRFNDALRIKYSHSLVRYIYIYIYIYIYVKPRSILCVNHHRIGWHRSSTKTIVQIWWHGNTSHSTDPMWGVSTSDQWIPCTKVQQSGALMFPLLLA